ncbi:MAG: TlyA family RNA methyltransferase [bacterium]
MRLDIYLVTNNLFESREKATFAIKNGAISVDSKICLKPSLDITIQNVKVIAEVLPFVSRGGFKLDHAIKKFNLKFNNKVVLDIGASTGGFTDVALQNNAAKVVCVDVGTNQLHEKIRNNEKVVFYENLNILDFKTEEVFDYLVMDVSFVSIKTIIPSLLQFMTDTNYLVALIKPQYEVGKMKVKNGIVRDSKVHENVINEVIQLASTIGLNTIQLEASPITGKMGNKEYLILLSKVKSSNIINVRKII